MGNSPHGHHSDRLRLHDFEFDFGPKISPEKRSPTVLPEAQIVLRDSLYGRFLLEGATDLGQSQLGFVNIYNAEALNSVSGGRLSEFSSAFIFSSTDQHLQEVRLPQDVCASAILPTSDHELALLVTNKGLYLLRLSTLELQFFRELEFSKQWPTSTRPNHCSVDPCGNLLISWMGESQHRADHKKTPGQLWQISPEGNEKLLLENLFIPNGHVYIPLSGGTYRFLLNDTARSTRYPEAERAIDEYHYDPHSARLEHIGHWFTFPGGRNLCEFPDGMAISGNGEILLVPMFLGGGVDLIDTNARTLLGRIKIPGANQATSVALINSTAYVTTASEFFQPSDFQSFPNAGCLAMADLSGLEIFASEPNRFRLPDLFTC